MDDKKNFRIKRHYSIVAHTPNVVELRYGVWNPISYTLTDEEESGHLFRLLSLLDGTLSASEIARAEKIPQADVEALLDHLIELGVAESGSSSSLDYYLDQIIPTLRNADGNSGEGRPVVLIGDQDLCSEIERYLRQTLRHVELAIPPADDPRIAALQRSDTLWLQNGIEFQEKVTLFEPWRNHFLIYAAKIINPVLLRALNRISLEHGIPWIHAALDGPFVFVGPIFVPHRSACYECFETRVIMNLRESTSYQAYKRALVERHIRYGQLPLEPVLAGVLASHTAIESLNFILTENSFTVGKVLAIYLPTMEFTFNEVLRVPGCAACGSSPERDDKELYFDMRALIRDR